MPLGVDRFGNGVSFSGARILTVSPLRERIAVMAAILVRTGGRLSNARKTG